MCREPEEFRALLERVRRRCPQAIRDLCDAYRPAVLKVIRCCVDKRLRKVVDPDDLVQDVFAEFLVSYAPDRRFEHPAQLEAFLSEQARHKCRDAERRFLDRKRGSLAHETSLDGPDVDAEALRAPEPPPDVVVTARDLWAHCLVGLSGLEQEIVRLRADELTNQEVADRVGVSERTVRRAVAKFAERYAAAG